MKSLFVAVLGVLAFVAVASGQGGLITVQDDGNVKPGHSATFTFHYYNGTGGYIQGMTNGFLFSGCTPVSTSMLDDMSQYFDLLRHVRIESTNPQLVTGSFSIMQFPGIPNGYDEDVFSVTTDVLIDGDTVCIDSSFYPPHNIWLWAPGDVVPSWGGPYCWAVEYDQPSPPNMINCPPDYTGSHCYTIAQQFEMFDPYGGEGGPFVSYFQILSGPGSINQASGIYTYTPSLADVGAPVAVIIQACDDFPRCGPAVCIFNMNFTNEAPVFTGGPGHYIVGQGSTLEVTLAGDPVDCDTALTISLLNVDPEPIGPYSFDGERLSFTPAIAPNGDNETTTFSFELTDGYAAVGDEVVVDIIPFCCTLRGDVDDNGVGPDIADLVYLVDYMFNGGPLLLCHSNADIDGNGIGPDIVDLVYLVNFMFNGGPPPAPCP